MINLIQPITVQQAYDGITHARWWASWNVWWRMVDDDDGDGFPSPEPRTDSRSALPREFRAWRRLRIIKRDESFSLIFFSPNMNIWSWVEVGGALGGPRGRGRTLGGRPPPSWPPLLFLGGGSKSPGSRSVRKSRSRRFYSVWTPFDIPFIWNTEIGKKHQFWAGPPVNRLVPKII